MNLSPKAVADYAVSLHQRNSECLGFIPRSRIEEYAETGQIILAHDGGCEAGYLVLGRSYRAGRIYQACIETDLRLLGLGRELTNQAESLARLDGATKLRLRCRDNLSSNVFWSALGFEKVGMVNGGLRRGRMLNIYEKDISDSIQLRFDLKEDLGWQKRLR